MDRKWIGFWTLVPYLLYTLFVFSSMCCTFNTSGLPISAPLNHYYDCTAEIKTQKKQNLDLNLTVSRLAVTPVSQSSAVKGLLEDKSKTYKPYHDRNWVVKGTNYEPLKGADLVMTYFDDRGVTDPQQTKIRWQNNSGKLFVCYDSRASKPPGWLTGSYTKLINSQTGAPFVVTITMPDYSVSPTGSTVNLQVWQYDTKKTFSTGDEITIQGNQSGFPQWPVSVPGGWKAMYFVLVQPETKLVQTSLLLKDIAEGCYDGSQSAVSAANAECEKERNKLKAGYDSVKCEPAVCTVDKICEDSSNRSGLTVNKSFLHRSEIEFGATQSKAIIKVKGKQETRGVYGTLQFEYLADTHDIRINSLILNIDDFHVSDVGDLADIAIVMYDTSTAYCMDTYPKNPCDLYQIRVGEFACSESLKVNDDLLLFITENLLPVDVNINHTNKTFQLKGGPLSSTIYVDGDPTTVEISIDLLGTFLNFAPEAVGLESEKFAPCSEETNNVPINLYASGSFDVYDSIPANNYEWYEDYGLVTEKFRGTGSHVVIPQGSLSFGVHSITLLVRDNDGVVDTDSFDVDVYDQTPPSLTIPPDAYRMVIPPDQTPALVSLGQASASDGCSSQVLVTNDAPSDSRFAAGVTPVTWTADDGRGNLKSLVQKVFVFEVQEPSVCDLADWNVQLKESLNFGEYLIQECGDREECGVDLNALSDVIRSLMTIVEQQGVGSGDLGADLLEELGAAESEVLEAAGFLADSNDQAEQRVTLRDAAVQRMEAAVTRIGAAVDLVSPPAPLDGVWKDSPPGSDTTTMNFYVQTYGTGAVLIIASPDGITASAFLDEDPSDGFDAWDLGSAGHRLTASFSGSDQGTAALTPVGSSSVNYTIYRWFPASSGQGFSGIFKDADPGESVSMNFFIQTYDTSTIVITTPDALRFNVFLSPVSRGVVNVPSMGGGEFLSLSMDSSGEGSAWMSSDDGESRVSQVRSWYPSTFGAVIAGTVRNSAGEPLAGVDIVFEGLGTATTDGEGAYQIRMNQCSGWSGTSVPSLEGYSFVPESRSYTDVTEDQTGRDFTAVTGGEPTEVTLSGTVRHEGDLLEGIRLTVGGVGEVYTDASGRYEVVLNAGWSGSVVPVSEEYTFDPAQRTYDYVSEDLPDQDFEAFPAGEPGTPVTISGTVTSGGDPLGGVVIQFDGAESAVTDAFGYYSMEVPYGWAGSVAPVSEEYTFDPVSRPYEGLTESVAGQDFEAASTGPSPQPIISGTVRVEGAPLAGIIIFFEGLGSVPTNESGTYSMQVPYGWGGAVTPTSELYDFEPPEYGFDNVVSDLDGRDFEAVPKAHDPVTISGTVAVLGDPIPGVSIQVTEVGTVTTNGQGVYTVQVPYGWSGTVTPSYGESTFDPESLSYENVTSNQTGQDFNLVPS